MAEVISFAGVVSAALLVYLLGRRRDRQAQWEEEQIRSTTESCKLLMTYSGLELRQRLVELGTATPEVVLQEARRVVSRRPVGCVLPRCPRDR